MSQGTASTRVSGLDATLDRQSGLVDGRELFAVVDLLEGSVALRRGLTDPSRPAGRRQQLVRELLSGRVGDGVLSVVVEAAGQRWGAPSAMLEAVERQGVRAVLGTGGGADLDEVEDELFRFGRLVAAQPELREALADRSRPLSGRQELVRSLLTDRTSPATLELSVRAVRARRRTFAATVEHYLELAAQVRQRVVATVRVARALDADQTTRLRSALTAQVGRDVTLHVVVDPAVLGGIRVELGDQVIEGTVAARLEDARRRFH